MAYLPASELSDISPHLLSLSPLSLIAAAAQYSDNCQNLSFAHLAPGYIFLPRPRHKLWLWWAGAGLFVAQHTPAGVYSNTRRPGLNLESLKGIMCSLGLIGKLFIQQNFTFQVIFNLKYCYRRLRLRIRA